MGRARPKWMYSIFAKKSGAIRYPAAIIPKLVAAANQNADVSVNALAVGFPIDIILVTSSDKMTTPMNASRDYRLWVIRYWKNINVKTINK